LKFTDRHFIVTFLYLETFSIFFTCRLANNSEYQPKNCDEILKTLEIFKNPDTFDRSLAEAGLKSRKSYSYIMSKNKFQNDEYSSELRQVHASKLAFR
jgi:hypothetical protein